MYEVDIGYVVGNGKEGTLFWRFMKNCLREKKVAASS